MMLGAAFLPLLLHTFCSKRTLLAPTLKPHTHTHTYTHTHTPHPLTTHPHTAHPHPHPQVYVIGEAGILEELDLKGIPYLGGPDDATKTVALKAGEYMEHDPEVQGGRGGGWG
jgi:hypothetical protein